MNIVKKLWIFAMYKSMCWALSAMHTPSCSSRADTHLKKLQYSLSKCTAWRHFWKETHSCIPTRWGIIVDESYHCVVLPPYLSHPPPSIASHPSPTNLHQRLLHFMRPEGMPTDSPAQVQQSMLNKYKGREIANCSCCNLTLSWDKPQAMCTSLQLRETDVSISMVYVPWQNIKPAYCSLARARPTMIQHLPSIVVTYTCSTLWYSYICWHSRSLVFQRKCLWWGDECLCCSIPTLAVSTLSVSAFKTSTNWTYHIE